MTKPSEELQAKKSINANGMIRVHPRTGEFEFENNETKRKIKATMSYSLQQELISMFKFTEKNPRGFAKGKIQIMFY
jgi:hypothetical protein